ncbi:Asp-tRNA(Asn)/Glu-tRNA(Gln) amidotransferase subunit GatA [Candidatus Micrarchaeota archaeon]|nr:Asp-tRNA(Asn)/Glu-tRNA(Gln) amidotransferase subunit GatA [Candidatus Micrarchaeota archaeon]
MLEKKLVELKSGKLSPSANLQGFLKKIGESEGKIGAFLEVYEKEAIERAAYLDGKKTKGELYGLVVSIKNNLAFKGHKMTCASKMLENYVAPYSATVVEKLLAQDAIIIGAVNQDEFACGSDCSYSALKETSNPVNIDRVPGGSSGGSGASVAAGFCDLSLGSDTGGSIRCPAAFMGVVGFKPSYGRVSRYGLSDLAMSFDQIGPLSQTVFGAKLAARVISGADERDSTTCGVKPIGETIKQKLPLNAAVPKQFFEGCDKEVSALVKKTIEKLESKGLVNVTEIDLPVLKYAIPIYYLNVFSEFASAMQKFDGMRYGQPWEGSDLISAVSAVRSNNFGPEVKRRILLGTYITTKEFRDAWYTKALKARQLFKSELEKVLADYDLLLGPTMPFAAWKKGQNANNPLAMYLADVLTIPANTAGIPAGSVPIGLTPKEKMPVGLQVMAGWGKDELVLEAMAQAEKIVNA